MDEQTAVVRRLPHRGGGRCYGGVCRDRIEDFRLHGPEPYEFVGRPQQVGGRPHEDMPARIMYATDGRIGHLDGFGRITHESQVEHQMVGETRDSIENYCYGGVCGHLATANHVRVPALLPVPARAAYSRPMVGPLPAAFVEHRQPFQPIVEQRQPVLVEHRSQTSVGSRQPTTLVESRQPAENRQSSLVTNREPNVVGHSVANVTEDYHSEQDDHVTGKTRGTIEKYIAMKEDQLPSHNARGEGTVITFDHASGGLALRNGRVPDRYGVMDANPEDVTLKRSRVETYDDVKQRRKVVTQVS